MAEDGEFSRRFLHNQETFQRAPETQAEHRFPARASGIVDVPPGSRGPRSLYIRRNGDSFGFTLRHFIIYPPESISETDGRHAAVGALLAPMDTIFVKNVVERGPAKQAGLQRGDRILFVNGESVNNLSYSQVVQRIQSSPRYLHLLVVPKEEDILQKYFAETAHNPVSNQQAVEDRRRNFQVDAVSWRSLQNPTYNSVDYGYLAPRNQFPVQQQKSAENIHSSLREFVAHHHPRSSENIYSTPRDTLRSNDRKSLEIYSEPVINDSTQRPRAQPQVPLYKKMGRRASEGSSAGDTEYSLTCDEIETTMKSSKAPYSQDTYSSLEMPGLYYPAGCRLSLDAGNNRRESSSSLNSFESSSTLTGHETDDSIVMLRLRKSVQEKEDFLRNSLKPSESSLIQREFYSRPKKLEKAVWPPTDPQESPSRLNKPTHQNFQRVKNDIEIEREISQNHENQPQKVGSKSDWQNHIKIQEAQDIQTNGTTADAEDRRNYPPNIQMVSRRARQFETGQMVAEDNPLLNDRTSFYRSELARLSEKRAVPNVVARTREFETMSNEPRRDTSSSSTSSAAVLRRSYRDSRSLDSSDLPNNANQSNNRMRARSNSTGSWVVAMQTPTETNKPFADTSTTTVCADKPLVVRRTKNTNITDEERVMRRESYLRATEGGRIYLETGADFSDGDISPQVLRSGSVSGGSSSSVSLEREKVTCGSPTEKEKPHFVREGLLHCKITEIDGKRSGDRSWKQVWAVLKGPKLFLYKDRHHQSPVGTSEVAEQSLASGVDMRGSCVQVAEDYTKRKHVLRVSSVLPCRSEVLLQADNPAELAEWVQQLQEQSARSTEFETKLNQISGSNNKQQAVPQSVAATTSIQVPQHQKSKLPTLRNRSPTGQSPVSKTRKPSQISDPSTSPKSKTWRGRVAKQFRKIHQGGSSPNSPTAPEGSTFGNLIEHCLPSINNTFVPRLVETCTEIVENKGFEIVGIYRVPGNSAAISALTEEVNKCYDDVIINDPRWSDVHVVSSLLKSFFRKMPDSLLTMSAYSNFIEADKLDNPKERLAAIRRLVKSLPPHNYHTLKHLILHLKKVSEHSTVNKMDAKNLAIVFGPTIVRDGNENMETMVNDMTHQCKIVESLLLQADWFFADDDAECILPAPIATVEIFTTESEISLLKDNISKVESLSQIKEQKKKSWASKYKKKPVKGQNSNETKTDSASPNGHKKFPLEEFTNNTSDLKESTIEPKPNVIPTTVTDMESSATESSRDESRRRIGSFIQENIQGQDSVFYYKKGREDYRRRIENFIQETQSNLQRPRKHETSSNNSLEMKSQNSISSSTTNVRHSLTVNAISDNRTITKTHSASNVFARSAENGRNTIGSSVQFNKPGYLFASDKQNNAVNSLKDSYSDVSSTSSDSRSKHFTFAMRRGSSAENITNSIDLNANGNLKKVKYENESDAGQKTGSLDSLNKLPTDDGGDLLSSITKILDEKISSSHKQSPLSLENIPYVDESPEKVSRQSLSYINKENIPSSPKVYRNPSLHKSQYGFSKLLAGYPHEAQKLKEKQEDKEKDEDSSLELNLPDNERHLEKLSNKVNILGNSKLKRSESLNKPDRTVSPLSNKLKRSESLNKDKLKRSDSLTKNEKTESNISKKREIGSARRATKDFTKLKRKNGMPERSIKRRHTVGGTKDPDKITLLDNRCQEEMNDINENAKEKNMRTSSPDLSSTRRELFFEVNVIGTENMFYTFRQQLIGTRPQSFPESTVYKVPLESQV